MRIAPDRDYVEKLFGFLETGDSAKFFEHVADDVDWTVMGTHPLAGQYQSKDEFVKATFDRLNPLMVEGVAVLKVNHILISGDEAAVEMTSLSTARNGRPFDNIYCWVVRFHGATIVEVRTYVDSVVVQRLIDENE